MTMAYPNFDPNLVNTGEQLDSSPVGAIEPSPTWPNPLEQQESMAGNGQLGNMGSNVNYGVLPPNMARWNDSVRPPSNTIDPYPFPLPQNPIRPLPVFSPSDQPLGPMTRQAIMSRRENAGAYQPPVWEDLLSEYQKRGRSFIPKDVQALVDTGRRDEAARLMRTYMDTRPVEEGAAMRPELAPVMGNGQDVIADNTMAAPVFQPPGVELSQAASQVVPYSGMPGFPQAPQVPQQPYEGMPGFPQPPQQPANQPEPRLASDWLNTGYQQPGSTRIAYDAEGNLYNPGARGAQPIIDDDWGRGADPTATAGNGGGQGAPIWASESATGPEVPSQPAYAPIGARPQRPGDVFEYVAPDAPAGPQVEEMNRMLLETMLGNKELPFMSDIMAANRQSQMREMEGLKQRLATRGVLSSTPGDTARAQMMTQHRGENAATTMGALGALLGPMSGVSSNIFGQRNLSGQQHMDNWFKFLQSQQQSDQIRKQQQSQSLALMLNALGMGTVNPQMPNFSIPSAGPSTAESAGNLIGNLGSAWLSGGGGNPFDNEKD